MSDQTAPRSPQLPPTTISIPGDFQIVPQDDRLQGDTQDQIRASLMSTNAKSNLGVLSAFKGVFHGKGFNLIFRPNNGTKGTTFPKPISPPIPTPPSENALELNLTVETLSFSNQKALSTIPNRGLGTQADVDLSGVSYVQTVADVTNPSNGKGDMKPKGIHFEPGLWIRVPKTDTDPVLPASLTRMASIPHGTTINAQCLAPEKSFPGTPQIRSVDITPFVIGNPQQRIPFAAQKVDATDTPRIPQDLSKFITAGTITQAILDDPNEVLRKANEGLKFKETFFFTVSTTPVDSVLGGGTANIAFLQGSPAGPNNGPNANAAQMSATFWIETIEWVLDIPVTKGDKPLVLKPAKAPANALVPKFCVQPPHPVTAPRTITVTSTQIQYSQTVGLNFAGLTWPHVSVATLIPTEEIVVPASAFN